ncbi:MAG: 2-dehydropantoate 2-reductase [Candidatus Baltobacteraceae bacterium]
MSERIEPSPRAGGATYAVVGAGAIGSYVGASLARAGAAVTLVGRGAHLQAMRERGVFVRSPRGDFSARPAAASGLRGVAPVDVVILALKAHQLGSVLADLPGLFHAETSVVAMQNGIPWWYFQRHGGEYEGLVLESVDPGGRIAAAIAPERVIGCVVYTSTEVEAPGVVRHIEGTRFSLGEPDRSRSERVRRIAADLAAGGLKAPVDDDIRRDIWLKLLGNASFNPISALTRATLVEMTDDPGVEPLAREMMEESVAVAGKLGITFDITIAQRIDGARRVGAHKSSMLQDLESRRPLELDALTGVVVELGEKLGVPTPATRHVYALAKLLERGALAGR